MTRRVRYSVLAALLCGMVWAADEKKTDPQFEMRRYVIGILRRGPKWTAEQTPETKIIQDGHMANIRKMAAAGKLIVAGPFGGGSEMAGMFIFDAATPDEVRAMAESDPAVQSGRLVLELYPWYAAAGLKVNPPK